MTYRRNQQWQRRYGYKNPVADQEDANSFQGAMADTLKRIEDIPLPNESESPSEFSTEFRNAGIPGIFNFLKSRIHLEEIILIGLILLLLEGGITGLEDEFLLVMLIYILLF